MMILQEDAPMVIYTMELLEGAVHDTEPISFVLQPRVISGQQSHSSPTPRQSYILKTISLRMMW